MIRQSEALTVIRCPDCRNKLINGLLYGRGYIKCRTCKKTIEFDKPHAPTLN
jgi:DNA-directed RNA polymerase subunit RPC12/RpoP